MEIYLRMCLRRAPAPFLDLFARRYPADGATFPHSSAWSPGTEWRVRCHINPVPVLTLSAKAMAVESVLAGSAHAPLQSASALLQWAMDSITLPAPVVQEFQEANDLVRVRIPKVFYGSERGDPDMRLVDLPASFKTAERARDVLKKMDDLSVCGLFASPF